jgi:hypothetical protein
MKIRIGYEIVYECPQPTPMILTLNIHYSRMNDVLVPDHLLTDPAVPLVAYRDGFGNWCSRIVAPRGDIRLYADGLVRDSGLVDDLAPGAQQIALQDLPEETLVFLLGSRYCETDRLSIRGLASVRADAARLGARAGDLRFRAPAHPVRLRVRTPDQDGLGGVQRARRRLP